MRRIFLVVKGNRVDAYAQAQLRHIDLEINADSDLHSEVYCYAPTSDAAKIIEWYCEDAGIAAPAKPGDCLWYSKRED